MLARENSNDFNSQISLFAKKISKCHFLCLTLKVKLPEVVFSLKTWPLGNRQKGEKKDAV